MIFMVIDGCKIDSSQSIPTGNQIDSALAGIVLEGGQDIFLKCWINMTETQKLGDNVKDSCFTYF